MSRLLLLVCAALGLAAARPTNDFKSVIVAAQFQCDDALCPDWELDLARVNPSSPPIKSITKLSLLAPEAPVASMSYPVFTTYHDPSRTVFTVGANVGGFASEPTCIAISVGNPLVCVRKAARSPIFLLPCAAYVL
jgi:hypothetical protein